MKLFVYGTLRQGFGNHGLIRHCQKIADATIPATLHVSGWLPMITHPVEPNHRVMGEIYELIDQETVRRVDRLEGHPDWYCREEVEAVTPDGQNMTVWAYFMPPDRLDSNNAVADGGDYAKLAR